MNNPEPLTEPPNSPEERHRRKCHICNHPNRDLIDDAFIDWGSPFGISSFYNLPDGSLHRHAKATGLYPRREANIRAALAYTCLTKDNKWIEPFSRVVFSTQSPPQLNINPEPDEKSSLAAPQSQLLIAAIEIRNDLNSLTLNADVVSNRSSSCDYSEVPAD